MSSITDPSATPAAQESLGCAALAAKMASPNEHFPFSINGYVSCLSVSTRITPAAGAVGVNVDSGMAVSGAAVDSETGSGVSTAGAVVCTDPQAIELRINIKN